MCIYNSTYLYYAYVCVYIYILSNTAIKQWECATNFPSAIPVVIHRSPKAPNPRQALAVPSIDHEAGASDLAMAMGHG